MSKTVLITGASSGIGEELAYQLSELNCNLILSSRREEVLETVKSKCKFPENIKVIPLDLAKTEAMNPIVKDAWNCFGKIDILINSWFKFKYSVCFNSCIQFCHKFM